MKAYLSTQAHRGIGFFCDVVSEQDYHDGGPHARSYRSPTCADRSTAEAKAREWAEEHGYRIYSADEISA